MRTVRYFREEKNDLEFYKHVRAIYFRSHCVYPFLVFRNFLLNSECEYINLRKTVLRQ